MEKKKLDRRTFLKYGSVAILASTDVLPRTIALAEEDWKPNHPIRLYIQYAAGGGTDMNLRLLAKGMEEVLGQPINCMNMTGALGSICAAYVYGQPADGYTWMGAGDYNPYYRILDINPTIGWRDWQYFQSAASIASYGVLPGSPIKNFEDLIKMAKAKPDSLKVSTDGKSGMWAEGLTIIADAAGFTFKNIPYDGGAPATMACLQGEVDAAASGLHEQVEFIRGGKLRSLGIFSDTDMEVPGVGVIKPIVDIVPGVKAHAPFGGVYNLALKRDTPKPVLMAIKKAFIHAVQSSPYQELIKRRCFKTQMAFGREVDKRIALRECVSAWLYYKWGIGKKTPEALGLPKLEDFNKWWPPKDYRPSVVD